jgi:hypothetical protein
MSFDLGVASCIKIEFVFEAHTCRLSVEFAATLALDPTLNPWTGCQEHDIQQKHLLASGLNTNPVRQNLQKDWLNTNNQNMKHKRITLK